MFGFGNERREGIGEMQISPYNHNHIGEMQSGCVDVRHVVAGLLTLSMFVMLANMIKSDHFSSSLHVKVDMVNLEEPPAFANNITSTLQHRNSMLAPCWPKPTSQNMDESKGFITFSLTTGPEHHISQVTDAVVIARYLGATLVLPDIRGHEVGQRRNFEDIYDVDKFISALSGIIKVTKELPADVAATRKPAVLRITNRVSEYKIEKRIRPVFKRNNYLRLALIYQSTNLEPKKQLYPKNELRATACIAMFQTLELQPELQEVGDAMIERLKELGAKSSDAEFTAIDWKSSCVVNGVTGRKTCYNASEVATFLKKVGFGEETVLYLTETWWHESFNPLKDAFPKTFTKDDILPIKKKGRFLKPGNEDLEKAIDIHVCTNSDTFVTAVSGSFYRHVSGKRIASGRTRILVPPDQSASDEWAHDSDFVSPFVSKKSHVAYSCYC